MDKQFYVENRRRVAALMTVNDAMLFFSGESVRKTADENFPFFTNRNFLYLTGIKQEQSALLLQKTGDLVSECLFVNKPNFEREIWTGRRFTEEEIKEIRSRLPPSTTRISSAPSAEAIAAAIECSSSSVGMMTEMRAAAAVIARFPHPDAAGSMPP